MGSDMLTPCLTVRQGRQQDSVLTVCSVFYLKVKHMHSNFSFIALFTVAFSVLNQLVFNMGYYYITVNLYFSFYFFLFTFNRAV